MVSTVLKLIDAVFALWFQMSSAELYGVPFAVDVKLLFWERSIMKKFKQKVFDGFSTSQASSTGSSVNRTEVEIPEVLGSANFELRKVFVISKLEIVISDCLSNQ